MHSLPSGEYPRRSKPEPQRLWWFAIIGSVLVAIVLLLLPHRKTSDAEDPASVGASSESEGGISERAGFHKTRSAGFRDRAQTAEEIVAEKLRRFGKNRRELVHTLATRFGVEVPGDVERFFDAVERGNWEEIDAAHAALLASPDQHNQPRSSELHKIWRPIQEAWGAAREAHNWPAQELLDYGRSVLDSLRPDMVYVGGTDPGCFIPTFLNATSDGEQHVTLTQNALADGTYLDYLSTLYGDRLNTLTGEDSQRAFQDYIEDARKRLQHDLDFPDEPKQVKPGENIRMTDGRLEVGGIGAVMAVNERLFQILMKNNPGVSFAMEQSFPFQSTYANAIPLGPVMEVGVQDPQTALTAERAAQSVDYWRQAAERLLANPLVAEGSDPRKAYSKLACEQASLLLDRGFANEAEEQFKIAAQIHPASQDTVSRYVNLLTAQKRFADAAAILNRAVAADPGNKQFGEMLSKLAKN